MSFNVFNFFKRGEDLRTVLRDGYCMLEVSCWFAVAGDDGPFVRHKPYLPVAHGDHGLNGNTHTGFQHQAVTTTAIVRNLRSLVHLPSDTMPGKLANHAIAVRLHMVLDRPADISKMMPRRATLW